MPITLKDDSELEARNAPPAPRTDRKQRRRMLLALAVLLVAVVIVFIKDRELWFATGSDSDSSNQSTTPIAPGPAPSIPAADAAAPVAAPSTAKKRSVPRVSSATGKNPAPPMISATDRAVLPPLEVEVVAGNQHLPLAASNSSVKVEMQPSTVAGAGQAASAPAPDDNSDAKVSLSSNITARVSHPVQPNYPLLAKQMKVQGAVVLQALIDKTGHIEDLHVVSGPTILAAAAREAVKQWHFKPYYQSGQAVETEARITVNFTISTY